MQTPTSAATAYVEMLNLQSGIFHNALDGIDDQNALERPNNRVNHINWLLGHVATCRFMLLNLIGGNENDPYFHLYFKAIADDTNYPDLYAVRSNWEKASRLLIERVEALSPEEMESEIAGKGGKPKDILAFFIYHEAYHLGQIGYARKFLGLPVLKSN